MKLTIPVDPAVESLAKLFMDALEAGSDQMVYEVHRSANCDHECYQAAWGLLDSTARAAIKLSIEKFEHPGWVSNDFR